MKVTPISEAMRFVNSVREKRDDGGHHHDQGSEQQEKSDGDENASATPEAVGAAVQAFETDPQAQANGLHATLEPAGQGPGLRVTLKDGNGTVLRQLSGEEFLRLRQAAGGPATADTRAPGKIFDRQA